MIVYPVVVILWMAVTTATATPPPPTGYVKQPVDDKGKFNYRYHYKIDDSDDGSHGKSEMRSGERASGEYFINNEKSSTDVKYTADELGYHPVVKYRSMSQHSMADVQSAISEYAPVISLFNGTNIGNPVKLTGDRQASLDSESVPIDQDNKPNEETAFAESSTSISFVTNYMNDQEVNGNLEDSLAIENSGSFGQRVLDKIKSDVTPFADKDRTNYESSIEQMTTQLPDSTTSNSDSSSSLDDNSPTNNNTYNSALESIRKYLDLPPSRRKKITDRIRNFLMSDQESVGIDLHVNNVSFTEESNDNAGDNTDMNLMKISNEAEVPGRFTKPIVVAEVSNYKQYEYSTTFPCNDDVNDDAANSKENSPVTLTNMIDNTESLLITTTPTTTNDNYLSSDFDGSITTNPNDEYVVTTTSSLILNPIQAGVSLVNSEDTHLISGEPEAVTSEIPAAIQTTVIGDIMTEPTVASDNDNYYNNFKNSTDDTNGNFEDVSVSDAKVERLNYDKYNTSSTDGSSPVPVKPADDDPSFEIQKSIELYHSSPIQEIHYPGQLASEDFAYNQQYYVPQQYGSPYLQGYNTDNHDNQKRRDNEPDLLLQELRINPEKELPNNNFNFIVQDDIRKINVNNEDNGSKESVGLSESLMNQHVYLGESNEFVRNEESRETTPTTVSTVEEEYSQDNKIVSASTTVFPELEEFGAKLDKETIQSPSATDIPENDISIDTNPQKLPTAIGQEKSENVELNQIENNAEDKKTQNNPSNDEQQNHSYQLSENKIIDRPVEVNAEQSYSLPIENNLKNEVKYSANKLVELQGYPVHILQHYPSERIVENPANIPADVAKKMVENKRVEMAPPPQSLPLQSYTLGIPIKPYYSMFDTKKYMENSVNMPQGLYQYNSGYQQQQQQPENPPHYVYQKFGMLINKQPLQQQQQPTYQQSKKNTSYPYVRHYVYNHKPMAQRISFNKRFASYQPQQSSSSNNYQQINSNVYQQQLIGHQEQYTANQLVNLDNYQHPSAVAIPCAEEHTNAEDYHGPVPLPQLAPNLYQQNQMAQPIHLHTLSYFTNIPRFNSQILTKRINNKLPDVQYPKKNNFRQSKMEYGFKPPMVPSVQYDEQTAKRVDN